MQWEAGYLEYEFYFHILVEYKKYCCHHKLTDTGCWRNFSWLQQHKKNNSQTTSCQIFYWVFYDIAPTSAGDFIMFNAQKLFQNSNFQVVYVFPLISKLILAVVVEFLWRKDLFKCHLSCSVAIKYDLAASL